ncbi:hypothetical protein LL266_19295, partial [Vibrio anguillarum]|nr:hypothetical protein [Vibrio anguillarum]
NHTCSKSIQVRLRFREIMRGSLSTQHPMSPSDQFYSRAHELVQKLPDGVYESAKKIRERCGSLGDASVDALAELFPELDAKIIEELCSECNFT